MFCVLLNTLFICHAWGLKVVLNKFFVSHCCYIQLWQEASFLILFFLILENFCYYIFSPKNIIIVNRVEQIGRKLLKKNKITATQMLKCIVFICLFFIFKYSAESAEHRGHSWKNYNIFYRLQMLLSEASSSITNNHWITSSSSTGKETTAKKKVDHEIPIK
jgi:hypothetical protein